MDKALIKALQNIKSFSRKAMFMPKNKKEEVEEELEAKPKKRQMEVSEEDYEEETPKEKPKYTLLMMTGAKSAPKSEPDKTAKKKLK